MNQVPLSVLLNRLADIPDKPEHVLLVQDALAYYRIPISHSREKNPCGAGLSNLEKLNPYLDCNGELEDTNPHLQFRVSYTRESQLKFCASITMKQERTAKLAG